MCRKLSLWVALVMVVGLAGRASADLVGHWRLDDGSGTVATDSSGNGHDGELIGNPQWVDGVFGGALQFAGTPDKVDIPYSDQLNPENAFSASLWANVDPSGSGHRSPLTSRDDPPQAGYIIYVDPGNTWQFWTGPGWDNLGGPAVDLGEWTHVAITYADGDKKLYVNGAMVAEGNAEMVANPAQVLRIGAGASEMTGDFFFVGSVDDVAVFDHALTDAQVVAAMAGIAPAELAGKPSPADGAVDVSRDATLTWEPGECAATHDVYFGTAFDDVNDADRSEPMGVLVSEGQTAASYAPPAVLEFGQTYFWRVDEVNAAPDNTIFKGQVWSLTVEPFAYAIENIVATSNTTWTEGQGPERTVDGSGLDAADQHSTETSEMWVGSPVAGETPYIQFEFDGVYKLHEMLVWNYNMAFEAFLGMGVKDTTVEYSENGTDWTVLGDVVLNQGPGADTYTANTTVAFEGVAAKFVRLAINSSFVSTSMHGLSEVRFMSIPVYAREPQPVDGAVDVALDMVMSWRAGREAVSHEVNLGTDPNALALAGTTILPTYTPAVLDLDTTYAWQIVEVNEAETLSAWAGDVWSFTTQEYLVVDDFDAYNDDIDAGTTIWQSWIDGIDEPTHGGAVVGNAVSPFAEQTIVRSGQSLNLFYDNANASAISEADKTLSPAQDWTASGIKSLSLWFHGAAGNTGQLYVKINGTKIAYDGEAADLGRAVWLPWNIDLTTAGVNVGNVTVVTVGVEGTGAGVVYVDDIRLYAKTSEYVVPTDPDTANLVGHWAFEGDTNDSSGNGFNGTIDSAPTYVAGVEGQAISLNGTTDYVVVGPVGISGTDARTISGWAKPDTLTIPDWCNIFGFTASTGAVDLSFDMNKRGGQDQYCIHVYGWESNIMAIDLEWHHLAATYDGTTIAWYGDGRLVGTADRELATEDIVQMGKRAHSDPKWPGSIDEVRIYNTALSAGEIAGLAGRTMPLHKAF